MASHFPPRGTPAIQPIVGALYEGFCSHYRLKSHNPDTGVCMLVSAEGTCFYVSTTELAWRFSRKGGSVTTT